MTCCQTIVSIADFTGTPVAKLKAAAAELETSGGGTLLIPPGNYDLASSELTSPIELPSNVVVEGNGSTLTVTGTTTTTAVFRSINTSNVEIRNLRCIGNNRANLVYVDGCFFFYRQSAATGASNSGIRVGQVYLENFKSVHWLYIDNLSEAYPLCDILIENVTARSQPGNYVDTDITLNASVICIQGGDYSSIDQAYVDNVVIRQIDFDCYHMKTGIIIYHSVRNVMLCDIKVINAGLDEVFPNDKGCYAIQVYDRWGNGKGVDLRRIEVSARSCGVYVAGFRDVVIAGFEAYGQIDTNTSSLPKGGIVFNGTRDYTLRDGRIHDCVNGLQLCGPSISARANALVDNVQVDESVINALRIAPFANTPMQGVTLRDSRFVSLNRGADIRVSAEDALVLTDFAAIRCHFEATADFATGSYGFDGFALDRSHASARWHFEDCTFVGGGAAIRVRHMPGRLTLRHCRATGPGAVESLQLINCADIDLDDVEATAGSGGVAYNLNSATGVISRSVRGAGTTIVVGLGAAKPTHAGLKGQFVAALDYTVASAGDGQTQIIGWRCQGNTVWRPIVETVNAA